MYSALHEPCGHVSLWRTSASCPDVNERMTCHTCGEVCRVKAVFGPWRAKCLDCTHVDGHATLRQTVFAVAIKHVQERTWHTHRVRVWMFGDNDSVVIVTAQNVGTQAALTGTEGAPF